MDEKKRYGEVTAKYSVQYYGKELTIPEMLKVIGARLKVVTASSNDPNPVNSKRLTAVMSSLSCNWSTLVTLLRDAWSDCATSSEVFCVNETMFAYQPQGPQKVEFQESPTQMAFFVT